MFFNRKLIILTIMLFYIKNIYPKEYILNNKINQIFSSKNYQNIKDSVERLKEEYPYSEEIYFHYGTFLLEIDRTTEAIKEFHIVKKLNNHTLLPIDSMLSYSYMLIGDYENALNYAQSHYNKYPNLESAILDYLWLLYKNLQIQQAVDFAISQLDNFSNSFLVYSMLALLYGEIGNYVQAISYYDKADLLAESLSISNDSIISNYHNRFLLELDFMQFEKAKEVLYKSLSIQPENPLILRLLGGFYRLQMNYEKSLHYYNLSENYEAKLVERKETIRTPLGRSGLINLYLDFNKLEQAYNLIQEVNRQKNKIDWMKSFQINPYFFDTILKKQELRYWKLLKEEEHLKLHSSLRQVILSQWKKIMYSIIIFHKKIENYKSNINAKKYAQNFHNKEQIIYYGIETTYDYPFLQCKILKNAQSINSFSPNKKLNIEIQLVHLTKNKDLYEKIINQLSLPYQQYYNIENIVRLLKKTKVSKEKKLQLLSEIYNITPHITQVYQMPMQLDIQTRTERENKKIKKYLKSIHILEESFSPFLLKIHQNDSYLNINLYHNQSQIKHWTIEYDRNHNWRISFEQLRQYVFTSV